MSLLGWLAQPAVLPWVALLFGLCIGSFLNVVIHRLPRMMEREWREQCAELAGTPAAPDPKGRYNLLVPRSACPACGARIAALHNLPVLSWLALRGKCAACRAPISARYPLVEIFAGLVGAYAAWRYGPTLAGLGAMGFGWALLALTAIDLDTQLLPDDITLPLLWAGLLINMGGAFVPVRTALIGAMAGFIALWLV